IIRGTTMKTINLKQFSVDDLLTLRDRLNTMLESRVDRERRDLETRLKRLQRYKAANTTLRGEKPVAAATKKIARKKKSKATKKVASKFRNPETSSETWTGRGLQPRWLRAAINGSGKTVED